MRSLVLLAALAFLASLLAAQEHPVPETSIRHVTVIDVLTGTELKDQTVRIEGNRIAGIANTQESDSLCLTALTRTVRT